MKALPRHDDDAGRIGIANSEPATCVRPSCQKLASLNPPGVIHREYLDRSAPDCGNTLDNCSPDAEMIEPTVTSWIKPRDNLSHNRIDTGQVRAFAKIAAVTGKGQIARIVGPTVLTGYDVLDVVCKGATVLREEAIFTTVPGSVRTSTRVADSIATWRRKAGCGPSISELLQNLPR